MEEGGGPQAAGAEQGDRNENLEPERYEYNKQGDRNENLEPE